MQLWAAQEMGFLLGLVSLRKCPSCSRARAKAKRIQKALQERNLEAVRQALQATPQLAYPWEAYEVSLFQ